MKVIVLGRKVFVHQNCNILKNVKVSEAEFLRIEDGTQSEVVLDLNDTRRKSKVQNWREYGVVRRRARRMENVVELVVDGFKHYYLFSYNHEDFLMTLEDINNGKENPCKTLRMKILAKVTFA